MHYARNLFHGPTPSNKLAITLSHKNNRNRKSWSMILRPILWWKGINAFMTKESLQDPIFSMTSHNDTKYLNRMQCEASSMREQEIVGICLTKKIQILALPPKEMHNHQKRGPRQTLEILLIHSQRKT